jgi:hypothetical protein
MGANINDQPVQIIQGIFQYLSTGQLCTCALTQKSWQTIATPFIWRTISLRIAGPFKFQQQLSGKDLKLLKVSDAEQSTAMEAKQYTMTDLLRRHEKQGMMLRFTEELELDFGISTATTI